MYIKTDFDIGETVYFRNDPEQKPYLITGGRFSPLGVSYYACHIGEQKEAFKIELSRIKNERRPASYVFASENKETTSDLPDLYIEDIDLSVRAYNALKSMKIETLNEMAQKHKSDYLEQRGIGPAIINEIIDVLRQYGKHLKP